LTIVAITEKSDFWPSARSKIGYWLLSLHGVEWHAVSFLLERQIPVKEHSSMKKRGGEAEHPRTDWSRFDAKTPEQIEADIRDDPDAAPIVDADWFASANLVVPQPKEQISIRLDREVLDHFRQYPRYQTRINAILRAAMEYERKKSKAG
jgi:uncharacterized protein (DUF4415 family)